MKIKSPHDRFFRAAMAEKRVSTAFFKQHLPAEILKKLDLTSLQVRKDTFINTQLEESATDILFSVNWGSKPGYLYTLVEHQRKADSLMAFRFLSYTVQIIAQHLKETGSKKLPIVYTLLFFNGDSAYPYSTDLFDLFAPSRELAQQILFQPFQLVDLTQISDDALKQEAWSSILQMFMKHVFNRDVVTLVKNVLEALEDIEEEGGRDYIQEAFTYLFNTSDALDPRAFIQTLKNQLSLKTQEENIMTVAEYLRQEGREEAKNEVMTIAERLEAIGEARGIEKGMTEGEIKGKKAIVLKLLQQGMSREQVIRILELTDPMIEELFAVTS